MSVEKDLKIVKMQDVGLSGNQSVFINTNLCKYRIWSKYKRFHELGNIINFYIFIGTIKVKIAEDSSPIAIAYTKDFTKYFPEVDLLPTSL